MNAKKSVVMNIASVGILPLYYCHSQTVSIHVARTLYKAGVRVVEYTNRGVAALENFTAMKKVLGEELPLLQLGIGTVKSKEEAEAFVRAGADFIVAPIVNPEVAAVAKEAGIPWIPGCMTPTEIYQAQQLEATIIKLFPANILKPEFLRSILMLFLGQKFIPTGGQELDENNFRDWFQSGVMAVGLGNKLVSEDILVGGNYDLLYEKTVLVLETVRKVKNDLRNR
jgi:2-dehydro-3-deoxyphosphogluconate aldolase / (4S)-4-hydroxy-2-oxoglutarate aldolase